MITATNLNKSFSNIHAVDDVNLNIAPGEIYGLVGADGAGKTTTMRLICGALRMDAGDISVAGYDIRKQTEQARQHIGYLSQRFSMYEDLTVLENIRFFAEVRGLKSNEWYPRSMEILEFVGLATFKDRLAGMLSGGMKQKLGLASALVSSPQVLLLDEPTTGVDPVTRQDFWQLIIKLVSQFSSSPVISSNYQPENRKTGQPDNPKSVSVLISTPYMDEAARCHRVGFMKKGQIIAEGTPGQLRSMLNDRILELRGAPLPLLKQIAAQNPGVEDVRAFGDRLHLRVREGQADSVIKSLAKSIPAGGGQFVDARPIPPVLEDVFIALSHEE
ncbi:MAG: ABC transporter ATP-binding protein [Chloroflexi bacterium]|nr:MAG: ABC transporter ATP-binding protein [Chloroflexota bacterium]